MFAGFPNQPPLLTTPKVINTCFRITIESFGFEDENDYEYEISATLSIARAWARIILAGKKRRHSTTSFSVNVVVAEELSNVTRFIILRSEDGLISFNKDNSTKFLVNYKYNEVFRGV